MPFVSWEKLETNSRVYRPIFLHMGESTYPPDLVRISDIPKAFVPLDLVSEDLMPASCYYY